MNNGDIVYCSSRQGSYREHYNPIDYQTRWSGFVTVGDLTSSGMNRFIHYRNERADRLDKVTYVNTDHLIQFPNVRHPDLTFTGTGAPPVDKSYFFNVINDVSLLLRAVQRSFILDRINRIVAHHHDGTDEYFELLAEEVLSILSMKDLELIKQNLKEKC
jgi:hypothetical protein